MNPSPSSFTPAFRRPIWARQTAWAAWAARALVKLGLKPNQVSVFSLVFSLGAAACLLAFAHVTSAWRVALPFGAVGFIALRGLCNLLDGMMAVEGGLRTRSGDLFNELPDRFSDSVTLIGLGYSTGVHGIVPVLGWLAALLAAIVAFTRVLGVQAGATAQFCGPMAKTARMIAVVLASAGLVVEGALHLPSVSAGAGLGLIAAGCLLTIFRRAKRIVRELEVS